MAKEKFAFQAEVGRVLQIVARSLYSHKEIFLRELISNASDACDRLRFLALTDPSLLGTEGAFKVTLGVDKSARTLTVADNGIGMGRDELVENLGTVARSGTQGFLDKMTGDEKKDVALIGQFGVGFYSAFMVSRKLEVTTRKAGEDAAWLWASDGKGEFTVAEAERAGFGTTVTLHLAKGEDEFLDKARLESIVKAYSDHVAIPIVFADGEAEETLNTASAIWTRPKGEVTDDQLNEFYHHVAHALDTPWHVIFNRVEGVLAYTNLLFIPSARPFDLFEPERRHRVKLYVKRVFITDQAEALLPSYLRFLRGIVDSEDLALNISRESIQHDPKIARIRAGLVKRVLAELKKKADKEADAYAAFWENFGAVLKEGVYEDFANRDAILALSRFHTTGPDGLASLDDYLGRMKEGQDAIFTIAGEDLDVIRRSPQIEGFKARGVEVLLLSDAIDEFWIPAVGAYKDKPFKSVTQGSADLGKIARAPDAAGETDERAAEPVALVGLIAALKDALGDAVKDVRASERLTESPACLVADEGDMDMGLERMLRRHHHATLGDSTPRVLEINSAHALILRFAEVAESDVAGEALGDAAHLLLDQARIAEGEPVPDPAAFARRLASIMEKGMGV